MHPLIRFAPLFPLALVAAAVQAQAVEIELAPPAAHDVLVLADAGGAMEAPHAVIGGHDTLAFAAEQLGQGRVVKGAPYCADAEHESIQTLADGNRIVHKKVTRLCRDGEGRTRQEVERGGRRIVYLRDPVSRENWVLDPERKTARRIGPMGMHFEHDASAWREYGEKMREWAKSFSERVKRDANAPTPPVPPAPPTGWVAPGTPMAIPAAPPVPVVVTENEHEVRDAKGKPRKEVQVQVLRMDPPPVPMPPAAPLPPMVGVHHPAIAPLPPGVAMRWQMGAPRGPGVTTSLGTKEIEGVRANGERTTWTIEAGKIGNEKPIVMTRDVWTSPDLMLTVLSRDADPRSVETVYRLAKVKRGEPDAALMKVPAEYSTSGRPASAPKAAKG